MLGAIEQMRRRIAKFIIVTAIGIAIAITAVWFLSVHQAQRAIDQWAGIQRKNGVEVSWEELRFSGYPAQINAEIDDPQLVVRQPNRVATWKPPLLTFNFSSIAPNTIDFAGPGSHDFQVAFDDATWSAVVEAETLKGQAFFPPEEFQRIEQLAGRFAGVRVTLNGAADPLTVDSGDFEAKQHSPATADPQAVHPQGASFELDMAAQDIRLPADTLDPSVLEALGPLISAFATEVLVNGALDTGPVDAASLTAWRDAGGTVEFTFIELQWGPVRITADGTLALDDDLQPVGAFATRIAGLDKIITALETGGVLSPNDAAIARITLAILNRAPEDGGPSQAEIPVTLQDRILRLGPVPLTQFAPIAWE
jgi:hypothetical protein